MPKKLREGSLTDKEVSLILTLLKQSIYQNQEILGFINAARKADGRPDVNNGRITEVQYVIAGNLDKLSPAKKDRYAKIKPATLQEVDEFLSLYDNSEPDPLSDLKLKRYFPIKTKNPLVFNITETDQVECKKSFNAPMKTIAAFANNKGGYLVFGIENGTWKGEGLNDQKFENHDWKDMNQKIRSSLGMDICFSTKLWEVSGRKIGVMYIPPAHTKPVIFIKGVDGTTEGHIYYRYAGEDRLISPSELQKIIEDRIRQLSETVLMKHLSNILHFGIENTAVMNTQTGEVSGQSGNFLIDESLIPKIQFIREGQFVEKDGAPSLRLIGNIQSANAITVKKGLVSLTDGRVLMDFIEQNDVDDPAEYIKHLASTQRIWLPIYYFMNKAGLDKAGAIKILDTSGGKVGKIDSQKKRLNGKKSPKAMGNRGSYKKEILDIAAKAKLAGKTDDQIRRYFGALLHLNRDEIDKGYVFSFLQKHYERFYTNGDQSDKSLFCLVLSKIDELLFKP